MSRLSSWTPDVAEPGSEAASVGGTQTSRGLGLGVGAPLQHQAPGRCPRPGREWAVFEAMQQSRAQLGRAVASQTSLFFACPFVFLTPHHNRNSLSAGGPLF